METKLNSIETQKCLKLATLQVRLTSDDGQYTQVVQATTWTYSPSYIVSYISTQIVTLTSYVPCPVTTSYTTIYKCSTCGVCNTCGAAPTTCQPNLCSTQINDVVEATTTPYGSGEYAIAYVTNNNGQSYTTTIAASQCTAYEQLNLADYDCASLPACGCSSPVPVPVPAALTCEAKPCTTIDYEDGYYDTITEGTHYFFTEYARLTVNNQITSTPASLCAVLTTPTAWDVAATCVCGDDDGDDDFTTEYNVGEVITYTYTTHGSTIVVVTTLPSHGGPFHLTGSGGGNRVGGERGKVLFWVWTVCAIVAGVGMVVL